MIKIRESIKFGWNGFKRNWKPFIGISIIFGIIIILTTDKDPFSAKSIIGEMATAVWGLGAIVLSLKVVDGKKVSFSDFLNSYKDYKLIVLFALVSITSSVLFQLGMSLLIIPGLFIGARIFPAQYLIVDKHTSYIDSFKKSWNLTRGKTINLIFFEVAIFAVIILGFLALLVGTLVAIPIISIATAYVYRKLNS